MFAQILAFFGVVLFLCVIFWIVLRLLGWTLDETGTFEILNVYYVLLNGVDMNPTLDLHIQLITIFISFIGFIVLSGGLIAVCSNMVARRVELFQKGLVRYTHENHFLIFGDGENTAGVISAIFRGSVGALAQGFSGTTEAYQDEDIVIVTRGNVEALRERILADIKYEFSEKNYDNRVYFYAADMESNEQIAEFSPEKAKIIFILGDADKGPGRDIGNLSCMGALSYIIDNSASKHPIKRPIPIFVENDKMETFSILQKVERIPLRKGANIYAHSFNKHENCARKMWGLYSAPTPAIPAAFRPLDYVPITPNSTKYVHLVIIGLGSCGIALLQEALRICHYANYETKGKKTYITIIDRHFEEKRDALFAQLPNLEQIYDIELEYCSRNAESSEIRKKLKALARNPDCLLTVAVCLEDPEVALSVGLNLPEDLYCYETINKPYGNSVLIRQTIIGELANSVDGEDLRYRFVKIFGQQGDDFDAELLNDRIPMRINYDYETFDYENGKPLSDRIAEPTSPENIIAMEKAWHALPEYKRWSNRFQAEMFRTYLRTIGFDILRAGTCTRDQMLRVRERIIEHKDVLMRMEHRRWCAEKTLSGFSAGPERNNIRRIHPDICPFENLSEPKQNLSFRPILNLTYFLADDHWGIIEIDKT